MRSAHMVGGSTKWESAEIIRYAVIARPPLVEALLAQRRIALQQQLFSCRVKRAADAWLLSHVVAAQRLAGERNSTHPIFEGHLAIHDRVAVAVRFLHPPPVPVGEVTDC